MADGRAERLLSGVALGACVKEPRAVERAVGRMTLAVLSPRFPVAAPAALVVPASPPAAVRRRVRPRCGAAADGRAGAANLINDWAKRTKMPRENYFPGNLGSRR